jgi:hypothetical protein
MGNKATILATACVVILVVVFFEFYVFRTSVKQTLSDTTVIDGNVYSIKPTPYGIFTIRFFEFLSNGEMDAMSRTCFLLYPNEPTPGNFQAEPSGTIQILGPPPPWGEIMIDGWLYSQIATNLTAFTVPKSTITLWTETSNEPIPANAQVQH